MTPGADHDCGCRGRLISRRSQIALSWGLVVFVAGQAGLTILLSNRLLPCRDPELAAKLDALRNRRAEAPDRPLLLMVGSSRTLQGFEAGCLEGLSTPTGQSYTAFNLGVTAAGPLKEWLCLRAALDQGIRPDLLLVEILPPLFNEPGPGRMSEESWLAISRLSATDLSILSPYHSRPSWLWRTWARSRVVPGYTFRVPILNHVAASWAPPLPGAGLLAPIDRFGWQPFAQSVCNPETTAHLTDNQVRSLCQAYEDFRIGAGPRHALADLLRRCRQERIAVALVLMPEGSAFRRRSNSHVETALTEFLAEMSQSYNARLIDARDWIADSGFYDAHHLLPGGATEFSRRLARVLRPSTWEECRN
jgi:hypothetical protein